MSDDEGLTTGAAGRRLPSPEPAPPLENEGILSEILLRLPPAPSSLPRASLVAKLWHRIVSDPGFVRLFRARHRPNPPLLGFFSEGPRPVSFRPTLEPPDRIPRDCFSLPLETNPLAFFYRCEPEALRRSCLSCRHGFVLLLQDSLVLVWDPVTGQVSRMFFPREFSRKDIVAGEVLRAAGDANAGGYSPHFQVVLLFTKDTQTLIQVYSSETKVWGNPISAACAAATVNPGALIGRSLYWSLGGNILEFGLDRQSLEVMDADLLQNLAGPHRIWVMPVDGVVGCLFLSERHDIELWKWSADCNGWLRNIFYKLEELLPQGGHDAANGDIVGIVEDNDVFFLRTNIGVFKMHLKSMQCKKVSKMSDVHTVYPFTSVTAGLGIVKKKLRCGHICTKAEMHKPLVGLRSSIL